MQQGYALCILVSSIFWISLKLNAVVGLILLLIQGPELYTYQLHCSPLKDSMLCNTGSGNVLQPMCNAWLGLQIWGQIIQFAWNQMTLPTGGNGEKKEKKKRGHGFSEGSSSPSMCCTPGTKGFYMFTYPNALIRTGSCLATLLLSPWTSVGQCGWVAGCTTQVSTNQFTTAVLWMSMV